MLKNRAYLWIESYLFTPTPWQRGLSIALLPLSALYATFVTLKRFFAKKEYFSIPIVSVGNLIVGGSGKTPFIQSLVKEHEKPAIILRGYKRKTKGLRVVSLFGTIQASLAECGDEAMLYALTCKNALVIVSEDRVVAIKKAKALGATVVFLDDGFSKAHINKFDILIHAQKFSSGFCLPSGFLREPKSTIKCADLVIEEARDFERVVSVKNTTSKMVFVTAIANGKRIEKYLPDEVIEKHFFPDHYNFNEKELRKILEQSGATSLLITRKDWVKVKDFNIPFSFLELDLHVKHHVKGEIYKYIENFSKFNTPLKN